MWIGWFKAMKNSTGGNELKEGTNLMPRRPCQLVLAIYWHDCVLSIRLFGFGIIQKQRSGVGANYSAQELNGQIYLYFLYQAEIYLPIGEISFHPFSSLQKYRTYINLFVLLLGASSTFWSDQLLAPDHWRNISSVVLCWKVENMNLKSLLKWCI